MSDWQDIATAPKDGTVIQALNRRAKDWPEYKTFWGVGSSHTVEDDFGKPVRGYVVNSGKPWWLAEGGEKMAPTPTHWKPLSS